MAPLTRPSSNRLSAAPLQLNPDSDTSDTNGRTRRLFFVWLFPVRKAPATLRKTQTKVPDHPAMITRKSTQRKLIELMMLTAMARKNLGLYFCRRRRPGCHFTGRSRLDLTGNSDPDRLGAFLGVKRGIAALKVMVALLGIRASIRPAFFA